MNTYIYGKYSPDTVPQLDSNEFHCLCIFLGAYLKYSAETSYSSYEEYIEKNNLLNINERGIGCWHYVNKAHIFIREKLNYNTNSRYISRRQIRKLGFSGIGAPRMYPLSGERIQDVLFNYVFGESKLKAVRDTFIGYMLNKWNSLDENKSHLTENSGTAARENTFRKFISFQYDLLATKPKGERILKQLKANNTYDIIQVDLDNRGGTKGCQAAKPIPQIK